jgi:hypothetical protein
MKLAGPLKACIDIVHFAWPEELPADTHSIQSAFRRSFRHGFQLHFQLNDGVHSLLENLQTAVRRLKPALVIMFTNQNRTLFQKIFLSSKSAQYSFQAKTPLLVFNKEKQSNS